MRNPFLAPQRNQSREEDTPKRGLTPIPDNPAGDNVPYRGVVDHGVDWDESQSRDVPGYGDREVVTYEEPPNEPEPVPVRIVEEGSRERRRVRTVRAYAGGSTVGTSRAILGEDDMRTRARIKNLHATKQVFISDTLMDFTGVFLNGYPLAPGESYETYSHEPLYAVVDDTADSPVAVIMEYGVIL